jgi:hypothetical protein
LLEIIRKGLLQIEEWIHYVQQQIKRLFLSAVIPIYSSLVSFVQMIFNNFLSKIDLYLFEEPLYDYFVASFKFVGRAFQEVFSGVYSVIKKLVDLIKVFFSKMVGLVRALY